MLQVYVAPIPDKNEKHPPMVRFPLDLASFISATAYHNKKIANLKVYCILLLISMLCPTYMSMHNAGLCTISYTAAYRY